MVAVSLPATAKFWLRVRVIPGGCWVWVGSRNPRGYGIYSQYTPQGPKIIRAHRWSVVLDGRDPEGQTGSNHYNGGKTHCRNGHPFDDANTWRGSDNQRVCRACRRVPSIDRFIATSSTPETAA